MMANSDCHSRLSIIPLRAAEGFSFTQRGPHGAMRVMEKKKSLEDTAYCLRNELSSDLENQDEAKAK